MLAIKTKMDILNAMYWDRNKGNAGRLFPISISFLYFFVWYCLSIYKKSQLGCGWASFFFYLLASGLSGLDFFWGDCSAGFYWDWVFSRCFFSMLLSIYEIFLLFYFLSFSNLRIFCAAYSKILNFTSYLKASVMKSTKDKVETYIYRLRWGQISR